MSVAEMDIGETPQWAANPAIAALSDRLAMSVTAPMANVCVSRISQDKNAMNAPSAINGMSTNPMNVYLAIAMRMAV